MFAFVVTITILQALAFFTRLDYASGKKPRAALTHKQEVFGLGMTAFFFLWGIAILLFGW